MKNFIKWLGAQSRPLLSALCVIALVAVIGFSFAACDNGSTDGGGGGGGGGGSGNSALNGTWVSDSDQLILNNGNAEWKDSGTSVMKATYTTSGSSITFNITQMWGPTLGDEFDSRWYTKAELITAGASASFFSFTGSYTAVTLTFTWMGDDYSYTKSGGSTSGGDSAVNGTWVSDSDQLILNNGNAEWKENGTSVMKAAYTASGSSITFNISQMWGTILGDEFDLRWYTEAELIEAGASASFFSFTGSYTATTLTFTWMGDNYSYTKSGGTTPGTGGSDGRTWTVVDLTGILDWDRMHGIAWGNGKFVAGGTSSTMVYSADGVTWTPVADSTFDGSINAIVYDGGKFVAGGNYGKMATSTDGITWTAVSDSKFGSTSAIHAIAYGDGKFVAVGYNGKMATSSNGETWTAVSDSKFGSSDSIYTIAYGNGKFVAGGYGDGGKIAYSSDGINWTKVTNSTFDSEGTVYAIAYANGKFVTGNGSHSREMAYSSDGVNWTAANVVSTYLINIKAIAYGNGKFVAGGNYCETVTSSDGVNWTSVPNARSIDINTIAYGGGKFVAVGSLNTIAYSTGL
jgi:hypothetical protein